MVVRKVSVGILPVVRHELDDLEHAVLAIDVRNVDVRFDEDFEKPTPKYKIAAPPFYAAWGTVITHDSYAGLRVNGKNQVVDLWGKVIPGLYCGGESAGGCSQHGLGRCYTAGYIIGSSIPAEEPKT